MKKNILRLSAFAMIAVGLSSCLKDKKYDNNTIQSLRYTSDNQKVVSVALTTASAITDPEFNVALTPFNNSTSSTVLNLVPIRLAGGVAAAEDVAVVIDTPSVILNTYNTSPTGSFVYDLPDPTKYSIVSKTVIIPKGQNVGYLQIRLVPNDFIAGPADDAFAIPVKIVSVSSGYSIAQGRGQGIAAFIINNQYSGDYLSNATRIRYVGATVASGQVAEPPFTNVNVTKTYTTSGATSIKGGLGDSGSGVTVNLTITTGNVVLVTPTAGVTAAEIGTNIAPGSTYDPATKTYTIHASYHNTAGALRTVEEVIKKI